MRDPVLSFVSPVAISFTGMSFVGQNITYSSLTFLYKALNPR
jgi:hypothetical protein